MHIVPITWNVLTHREKISVIKQEVEKNKKKAALLHAVLKQKQSLSL